MLNTFPGTRIVCVALCARSSQVLRTLSNPPVTSMPCDAMYSTQRIASSCVPITVSVPRLKSNLQPCIHPARVNQQPAKSQSTHATVQHCTYIRNERSMLPAYPCSSSTKQQSKQGALKLKVASGRLASASYSLVVCKQSSHATQQTQVAHACETLSCVHRGRCIRVTVLTLSQEATSSWLEEGPNLTAAMPSPGGTASSVSACASVAIIDQ